MSNVEKVFMNKYIVIFTTPKMYREISDQLLFGICDFVNCRTKHNRTVFEIDEKDIRIDIRHGDINKSAGLRPTHVLFIGCSARFVAEWNYSMGGRFKKISNIDELINMIKEEKNNVKN